MELAAQQHSAVLNYTVGHKKTCHFYFYNNFGKCGPISIILSYSALYAIFRPSVCPSVRHTGGSVKDGAQPLPQSSP